MKNIDKNNVEEWKFGYVKGDYIAVFNESKYSFQIFGGHFLKDVRVEVKENGTLRITGSEIVFDYYLHKTFENEWQNEPEEDQIRDWKFLWMKGRYLYGWVKTKKRVPIDLEFGSGWKLERCEC